VKPIEEVYPRTSEYFWAPGDYGPLLESFGYPILLRVDDSDYQGDSRVLFRNVEQYGWLQFGWGSCSGCDALQACNSYEDIEKLRETLHGQIKWGTREELLKYFTEKDWTTDYSWHSEEQKRFVEEVKKLLS